ncbi:hypothetical protein H0H93_010036 [Arthromyces matolae]|nr:hypothetical protein H0H93_010036 [Arthromyces matolae]
MSQWVPALINDQLLKTWMSLTYSRSFNWDLTYLVILPLNTAAKASLQPTIQALDCQMLEYPLTTPHLRPDDPEIGALDAQVIAELPAHSTSSSKMLILSPNALWIPKVYLWKREVYVRSDGRFGFDDRTLWPQYYSYGFEYICCIPRQPEDVNDELSILWWTPRYGDFESQTHNSVDINLVKIPQTRLDALRKWRNKLVDQVDDYQTSHKPSPLLGCLATAMRHTFIRCSMAMRRIDLREAVPEFQRFCLDIIAWLRYVLEFSPRTHMPERLWKDEPVRHDLMGAVTEDPAIVQLLHQMRIPVWWVMSNQRLPETTNVLSECYLSLPRFIEENPMEPKRILCVQPAGSLIQQAMQRINCLFLDKISPAMDFPRPKNADIENRDRDAVTRPAPYPPPAPALVNNATSTYRSVNVRAIRDSNPITSTPNPPSLTPSPSKLASSDSTATNAENRYGAPIILNRVLRPAQQAFGGRNRFEDVDWDCMPSDLDAWGLAVKGINHPVNYQSPMSQGFPWPDPNNLAFSVTRRDEMLVTWLSRREAVMWFLMSKEYESMHNRCPGLPAFPPAQAWKAYLLRRLRIAVESTPRQDPSATGKKGVGRKSRSTRAREEAGDWFTQANLLISDMPQEVAFEGTTFPVSDKLPQTVVTKVLWECFENNFRFELTRLDEYIMSSDWADKNLRSQRETLIRTVFFDAIQKEDGSVVEGIGGDFVVTSHLVRKDMGLASADWTIRQRCINNLALLMATWPPVPSNYIPSNILGQDEASFKRSEQRPWGTSNLDWLPRIDAYGPDGPQVQLVPVQSQPPTVQQGLGYMSMSHTPQKLSANGHKKEVQWQRWQTEVIPSLVQPYLKLLQLTDSLRIDINSLRNDIESETGSPGTDYNTKPSLAVDLNMLEYAKEVFFRFPPNVTGWCEAVESFLAKRGYQLPDSGFMRRRFANAYHWYLRLQNATDASIKDHLNIARELLNDYESSQNTEKSQADEEDPGKLPRASEYLRGRCPACFGSDALHDDKFLADIIVCVDACFTQKRRHNPRGGGQGPKDAHPDTVFLAESQVKEMEKFMDISRKKKPKAPTQETKDGFEGVMKVPTSVLDDCQASFTAADSKRVKASTQFFADTGLMALLCRHDQVLWLVNMTSPGERQHYVFALLKQLFSHLPPTITVGILYDIGCQTHRTCIKWDFLEEDILSRITWAISVFHAFGHQWACQVIYHPRKCKGFGLTDGEGCERFWSMIKLLIPSLRVSGYHQRLYALDIHVEFLAKRNIMSLGSWLARKWRICQEKKKAAEDILAEIPISRDTLRKEWEEQVKEQTKPLARQSKEIGNKAIEEIMTLQENRKSIQAELSQVNLQMAEEDDDFISQTLRDEKETLLKSMEKVQASIKAKREKLGVDGRANLAKYKDNKFLQLRLNAQALKNRIRAKLRERKFELERLERAYRQTSSSERKLHTHIQTSAKRHDPAVVTLVTKHNKLVDEMEILKARGETGQHAIIPARIERSGLFKLDVDDEVWQDIRLGDDDGSQPIPNWLGDENTRKGIRAMLDLDRALEEEQRLSKERSAIQEWLIEEWACVEIAMQQSVNDTALSYQLGCWQKQLCAIYASWKPNTSNIPAMFEMPDEWGPDEHFTTSNTQIQVAEESDDEYSDLEDIDILEEDALLQAIEAADGEEKLGVTFEEEPEITYVMTPRGQKRRL